MTQEIIYQNKDLTNVNPLPPEPIGETETENSKKTSVSSPLPKKTKLLIILGIFTVVLIVLSFLVAQIKSSKTSVQSVVTPIPIPILTPAPTDIPETNIPQDLREKFNQIDTLNQTKVDFPPPQIDAKIGAS